MTILVTKPLHPLAFHLYSHHYRFHNIWMFNHRLTTKYFLFFDPRLLGNKIFYRVLREKLLELTVKLSRQCLIVRNDESQLIQLCDDVRHCKGLTGAGHTEQSLELIAFLEASYQFFDCLGLVTGWLVWGV